ncbi:MAG: NarK/NasA family nitrate transporter [Verrucomicrobia bacterium]|nr:MAG: NarK/NasA family nitrate transporter [Verrucomicrobiota bacterium]
MNEYHESFWKSGHLPTLIGAFLCFCVCSMCWLLLGGLGSSIATELGLTPAQKGLLTAVPLLGGGLLRLPFGWLTDAIGAKKTGLLVLALTAIPVLMGWLWASSFASLLVVGFLLGIAGAAFVVALPMASRWYPAKFQGVAMGLAGLGLTGTLIATFFGPRLAEKFGWHNVFGLALIPLAAVAVIFIVITKDAPVAAKKQSLGDFFGVLRERDMILFSLFYGVTFGGFVGFASFLSILLGDQYGLTKIHAGELAALGVMAGSLVRPIGGLLADKFGGIRMLNVLFGAVALLAMGVAQLPTLSVAVALFVIAMACLGFGNGSVFQLLPHRYGTRVGVATGILGAAGSFGGFFLPTILGWLKQTSGSYASGLALLAALAVVALMVLSVVQSDWVGNWIGKHGRVKTAEA